MHSVSEILPRASVQFRDRIAVITERESLTFGELAKRVNALAGGLKQLGLCRRDRVAMLDINSLFYLEMYYACVQAGLILVPLNYRLAVPELKYILNDASARALFVSQTFREVVPSADALPTEHVIACGYDRVPAGMRSCDDLVGSATPVSSVDQAEPDDVAQIFYTSGTTGLPKGVCTTNRNLLTTAYDVLITYDLNWDDVWLHAAPMFHLIDAWSFWAMGLVGAAQSVTHFEPERVIRAVSRAKATAMTLPPTAVTMLANHEGPIKDELQTLRFIMYGGSPAPANVLRKWYERLPCGFLHAYGTTENTGPAAVYHPRRLRGLSTEAQIAQLASAGHALPNIKIRIVDENGADLGPNQFGEILIGGPRIMKGYWNKPEATSAALKQGWYHSGDIGRLDAEGNLHVVDRKKDMIITGGENVFPAEVENIVVTHPGVVEVAVIGVPDERWGEVVKAFVVTNQELTSEAIINFCRGKIAGYKIPKTVEFSRDPLPKTGPGKIAKGKLRDGSWKRQKYLET